MRGLRELILRELAYSKKNLWSLLDRCQFLLRDVLDELNRLYDEGLIGVDEDGLYLTEKGRSLISPESLRLKAGLCEACKGRRITLDGEFKDLLREFKSIVKGRPRPVLDYFQGYMREYDVVARVALMNYYGDLSGREIILIGDDDLLSVALSLTELPSRILVLDIDERLGGFLEKINRDYGFQIEFKRHNVADPLPEDIIGSFDVFSSEPLETWSGLRAFIVRGVSCLREDGVGYFGLTRVEASLKKWRKVERLITEMNCAITDIIRDFSAYPMDYETVNYELFVKRLTFPVEKNPGIDWYKSTLFRIKALGKPKLIVDPHKRLKISYVDKDEDVTYPATYKT